MATSIRSIVAPIAATAANLPVAANDISGCWTSDPRAKLLLASCAAQPPAGGMQTSRYGNATDRWFAYTGYRVEALTAIKDEVGARALAYYHEHGEAGYEPFRLYCRQPSVTEAIDAAVAAGMEQAITAAVQLAPFEATIDTGHGDVVREFSAFPGQELSRLVEIDREARMANGRRPIVIVAV